jgi:solute carrier family 35 protein
MVDNSDFQDDFAGDDLDLAEDPDLDDKIPDFDEEGFEEGSQLLRPDEIGSSEAVAAAIKEGEKNIQQQEEESRPAKDYVIAAVAYSLCAATLLVINKASVDSIPSPAIVVASQLLFSAVAVKVLVYYGKVEAESLEIEKTKKFIGVSLLFTLCLVTNVKALKSTSVQTVIVMRACSPIFVALFDWLYLKTGFPHSTTWACLAGIAVGALIYCIFDDGFNMSSVLWPLIYFVSICSEMVFVKHIINTVEMSTWTRVYYNNMLGLVPVLLFGLVFGEYNTVSEKPITFGGCFVLLLACIVGLGISFAGFHARKLLSATSFTVLGVSNKFISITLSLIFIKSSKSVSMISLFGLFLCIVCATLYAKTKSK